MASARSRLLAGLRLDRRTLLLAGLGTLAAACGKAVRTVAGATGSGSPPGSTPTSPRVTGPPPSSASPVPAALRIPDRVLREDAPVLDGAWKGTWRSSDGSTGPLGLTVAIDVQARTARVEVTVGPGFFAADASPASEALEADLNAFAYMRPPYQGSSTIVGDWTLTGFGYGFVQLDSTGIPGHPEVAAFHTKGYVWGPNALPDGGAPFAYTITRTDGTTVKGSFTLRT